MERTSLIAGAQPQKRTREESSETSNDTRVRVVHRRLDPEKGDEAG